MCASHLLRIVDNVLPRETISRGAIIWLAMAAWTTLLPGRGILRQAGSPNAHQRRYRGCAGLSRSSPPPSPAARRSPTWWVVAAKVEPSAPRLLRLFQPTRL
jgi:hypothetical protein